jgi:phospholipid/cholesterol/gamma-HCH transport system substrate-binding protein
MGRHGVAEIVTGAVVLVIAALFLAYALSRSGTSLGGGYTLYADFGSVAGLNVGADVRLAGVKVGSVTGERLNPKTFEAVVTLSIDNDIQLPKDTGASIIDESLLGGKYISLSPGGDSQNLRPGQVITVTQSSINLEELLGKFIFSVTSLSGSKSGSGGGGSSGSGQDSGALAPLGGK